MNTKVRTSLKSRKAQLKHEQVKVEMQGSRLMDAEKATTNQGSSIKERKLALQRDVDKLKKRLRHEVNVHRALERAFTRPLGALPRLPPYLPPCILELLAEVAVLEEEIVRLEEQVVHFRQGLYQEAVYISSSNRNTDSSADLYDPYPIKNSKQKQAKFSVQTEGNSATSTMRHSLPDDGQQKENQLCTHSTKNKKPATLKVQTIKTQVKRPPVEYRPAERCLDPQKLQVCSDVTQFHEVKSQLSKIRYKHGLFNLQLECRVINHASPEATKSGIRDERSTGEENPNQISENLLKCLLNIFFRMSSSKNRHMTDTLPSLRALTSCESKGGTEFKDPYCMCSEFGKRDIGPYKHSITVEAASISPNRSTNSVLLVRRLKLLLRKLASVKLKGLSHQEKLAFWINIYNSCMMNAFLEHGIPESPEVVVELMQKATMNVGGHFVNAITIEHFILRLPYHSNYTFTKSAKYNEMIAGSAFGLELSEPLVTFALSCGSWSSPAVRVYTASEVENELEVAKKEYLQAAIGISTRRKLLGIPKLLDWYLLDFAMDLESLLDWIYLQLPSELGKDAMKCLERRKGDPLSQFVLVMPYEFSFRYLFRA